MDHPTTLIYLADAETLGQLHRDWPSDLRVALCLEDGGGSDVVFLREEEIAKTPEHVAAMLDRDDADFVIVPTFGGYPTRRLSFSQEQQLCGMLADMAELPDQARASFPDMAEDDVGDEVELDSELPVAPTLADQAPRLPEHAPARPSVKSRIARHSQAPEPVSPVSADAATGYWGQVTRLNSVWTFTVDGVSQDQPDDHDVFAHPLALSKDQRRLQAVLALDDEGQGGMPAAFQIPVNALPKGCPNWPAGSSHRVFLRVEGTALTITLPIRKPASAKKAKPRRRGLLGPAVAAATALVMVQVGTSQEAMDIMRAAGSYQSSFQGK